MIIKVVDGKHKRILENGKWINHRKYDLKSLRHSKRKNRVKRWSIMGVVCPNCNYAGNQDIFLETGNDKYFCDFCKNNKDLKEPISLEKLINTNYEYGHHNN